MRNEAVANMEKKDRKGEGRREKEEGRILEQGRSKAAYISVADRVLIVPLPPRRFPAAPGKHIVISALVVQNSSQRSLLSRRRFSTSLIFSNFCHKLDTTQDPNRGKQKECANANTMRPIDPVRPIKARPTFSAAGGRK